jgi:hypothetical protein
MRLLDVRHDELRMVFQSISNRITSHRDKGFKSLMLEEHGMMFKNTGWCNLEADWDEEWVHNGISVRNSTTLSKFSPWELITNMEGLMCGAPESSPQRRSSNESGCPDTKPFLCPTGRNFAGLDHRGLRLGLSSLVRKKGLSDEDRHLARKLVQEIHTEIKKRHGDLASHWLELRNGVVRDWEAEVAQMRREGDLKRREGEVLRREAHISRRQAELAEEERRLQEQREHARVRMGSSGESSHDCQDGAPP